MPVRELMLMGNPVLARRAIAVADPTSEEIRSLAQDMIDTMEAAGGMGIAAPQVGESVRLIVVRPLSSRESSDDAAPLTLVNPVFEPAGELQQNDVEGCLSIPGLRGVVKRWATIIWSAYDLRGQQIGGEARGLFARILQHEVDHLDGVFFLSRMSDITKLAMAGEARRLQAELEDAARS